VAAAGIAYVTQPFLHRIQRVDLATGGTTTLVGG
jgi:hypothetical protein